MRLGFFAHAAKLVRGVWGSRGAAVAASTSASVTANMASTSAGSHGGQSTVICGPSLCGHRTAT
ncbi:hypothetical protein C8J57DRAFT_1457989 [Mycena rebaudengoi]|nr:hypothetical protein C8J57DRAFT_1457989 [Mycena rebaudengoi]